MSKSLTVGIFLALVSLGLLYSVRKLSHLGRLKFAYALGWGVIGILGLLSSAAALAINWFAQSLEIPFGTLVVFIGIIFLVSLSMQLSISVSGLSRQLEKVSERVAELEHSANADR